MPNPTISDEEFWSRCIPEPNTGCWIWLRTVDADGYGTTKYRGRNMRATHVALALSGRPVERGLMALHRCDMPICINPDHLFVGTAMDNATDRDRKGRASTGESHYRKEPGRWLEAQPRGEQNGSAKLTAADVLKIRAMGVTAERGLLDLASMFRVSEANIRMILRQRTWRHLL